MITNAMSAAVGGMSAQATRFMHIGNNIANSSTTGYKSSDAVFADTLALVSGQAPNGSRLQPGAGVSVMGTTGDFSNGQLLDDTNPYHIGIQGDGFLPVSIGGQDYVTRSGDFSLVPNPNTTTGGFVMMRPNGSMLQGSSTGAAIDGIMVFSAAPTSIDIGVDGTIAVEPTSITVTNGTIRLKNFVNPDGLVRGEAQMYSETASASVVTNGGGSEALVPGSDNTGFLRQSSLEQSNVDLTNEFTKMIVSQRNFQANAKTITTADEMLNTAINVKR